ncbi:TPA: restriction endonuclease subunit S [Aeromonas hydrophila]|uniref:restriction endonuclease subunit S n=1 Tax=Aeromonas veronii TaxID=654 RepID=UPI003006B3CE
MSEVVTTRQQELAGKYRPYPEYKDSGVEWLGGIPNHWISVQSRRLFALRNTRARAGDRQLAATQKYGVIFQDIFMELEGRRVVQVQIGAEILKHVEPGDFVISMRSFQGGIEYCPYEGCVSSAYVPLTPIKWVHPDYFRYLFKSSPYIQALQSTSNLVRDGQALRFENFSLVDLPVVPIDEQRTIAAFLDYETARIDRLIAKQQRLIELLKEKRQAVISHAVTKGLNPNAPMKDSGVEWLGQVPEHWQIQKTAWHFTAQKGRNGQMLTKEYCGENSGDYPVYSGQTENNGIMGRIDSFEFDFGNDGCLFSTTVGAKAMSLSLLKGKFSLSQNCMIIIPRENNAFSVNFAFYHFQPLFSYERGLIPEHMQASFRMDDLYQYSIAMPPVSEQIEISDFINGEVIKIDYLVQIAEKAITLMQERRSALISAAVTGKIDLRGWTPPAEEVAA